MLILLTDKCSLSCKHCMQSASPTNNTFMSRDLFVHCLEKAKALGARVINLAGGEPTILDIATLREYLEMCFSYGFITTIETNGYFLEDAEKIDMFADLAKKYKEFYIQISSFKEYYTNVGIVRKSLLHDESAIKLWEVMGSRLSVAYENTSTIQLTALGRCSEGDMLEKAKVFNRFPSCINSFLIAKQTLMFDKPCYALENFGRFCVPMVDPKGGIHMGESIFCKKIGEITDNTDVIIKSIKEYKPCGKCANYHWHFDNPQTEKEKQVAKFLNS